MKVTINHIKYNLCENTQRNPLRWTLLKPTEPAIFVNTTCEFKCKDYFNDFVAYKHCGKEFYVYGMKNNVATFDAAGGLYVYLTGVEPHRSHASWRMNSLIPSPLPHPILVDRPHRHSPPNP